MDPFDSLPVELLVRILTYLQSERTTDKFTAASPTIFRAYASNKFQILSQRVAEDFDELMIQDAMFIILCPPHPAHAPASTESPSLSTSEPSSDNFRSFQGLFTAWKNYRLVNPLASRDKRLLGSLQQLRSHLLFYIEDYLTKATAVYPPRDYLCLPDRFGRLTFRGRRISSRLDAECLTKSERTRLFRAFLRCGVTATVSRFPRELLKGSHLRRYAGRKLVNHEHEALCCVGTYMATLRCALAAHNGDFWLPDVPQMPLPSTGLLAPDSLHVSAPAYFSEPLYAPMKTLAMIGSEIQAQLCKESKQSVYDDFFEVRVKGPTASITRPWEQFTGPERVVGSVPDDDIPGLYGRLRQGASWHVRTVYYQRAWAFLDDDRLFPKNTPIPLLPTDKELDAEYARAAAIVEWFTDPNRARQLRRSQSWHDQLEQENSK